LKAAISARIARAATTASAGVRKAAITASPIVLMTAPLLRTVTSCRRGAAIAVTLNERLDYFGQTANIAARIEHQAEADEIHMSEDVYEAPGVQALLELQKVESKVSQLKGVQQGLRLFCVSTERRDSR